VEVRRIDINFHLGPTAWMWTFIFMCYALINDIELWNSLG
jgi:hypothetical protein